MNFPYTRCVATVVACGALLLLLTVHASKAVPVSSGACNTPKTKYIVSETSQSITSISFVRVTETTITFATSVAGCAKITFSSEAFTSVDNEVLEIRAMLDGGGLCRPATSLFHSGSGPSANAMTFYCKGVAAGNHSVRIEFRTIGGNQVTLGFRTTAVSFP
jgi:hypothetical protein